ncbi:MAG TPA: abortive phage resistance protein [Bacteroidales bacterium]|nr:abortive phage resistance protein [Bacteroidales bacterium]
MTEPWNLKIDDKRLEDSLPNFIIFCEDEVSEPIYFKYFETSKIKINPVKKQQSKITNVLKAICYCEDKGLMESKNGTAVLQSENTQVWCVFDRDSEEDLTQVQLGNTSFNVSIDTAISKGFKVAWSNDSFELWILLHFEDVSHLNTAHKSRDYYYNRLTEIFKSLPNPNEDLTKALQYPTFNYKKDCKSEKNFRNIVRSEITGTTKDAIKRAIELEKLFNQSQILNHEKVPCTMIHHLVEELIRLGGKEI